MEIIKFLEKFPPAVSFFVLLILLMVFILIKWKLVSETIVSIMSKKNSDKKYYNFMTTLFVIREKYELKMNAVKNEILAGQMRFVELKIQDIIFYLSNSFNNDIKIERINDEDQNKRLFSSLLYCEAMKNSLLSVKDELRRSFKQNGFYRLSKVEFSHYVKEKKSSIITIIKLYLSSHYIDDSEIIITLKSRFDKLDDTHGDFIESWLFEIFEKAIDIDNACRAKLLKLSEEFEKEISRFIQQ